MYSERDREQHADKLAKLILYSFPIGFLGLWLYLAQFAWFGTNCSNLKLPPKERLDYCDRSDATAKIVHYVLPPAGHKRAKGKNKVLRSRAIAHAELGNSQEALELFRRSLARWPTDFKKLTRSQKSAIGHMERSSTPKVAHDIWRIAINEHFEAQ